MRDGIGAAVNGRWLVLGVTLEGEVTDQVRARVDEKLSQVSDDLKSG